MILHRLLAILVLLCTAVLTAAVSASDIKRNPSQSLGAQKSAVSTKTGLNLQSIIYSSRRALVIINGKTLQAGEVIDGYRLLEVLPNSARLQSIDSGEVKELTQKNTKSTAIIKQRSKASS